jgi:hypothetical protein
VHGLQNKIESMMQNKTVIDDDTNNIIIDDTLIDFKTCHVDWSKTDVIQLMRICALLYVKKQIFIKKIQIWNVILGKIWELSLHHWKSQDRIDFVLMLKCEDV